ncbi:MAG: permease [Firmicutes bacterium]|nr:permease [Bacillota bacterium]
MTALVINGITILILIWSLRKSPAKTKQALKIAFKRGRSLAPLMLLILIVIGLLLAFFPPKIIEQYLGGENSLGQLILAGGIGSLVMVPSLIAFPLAGSLLDAGAGYTPIAAFITTLTMVGFVSLPLELKEMGRRLTLHRNLFALISALLIAMVMGVIL